jgi:hypothetical protein
MSLIAILSWPVVVEWTEIRRYRIRKKSVILLFHGSFLSCLLNCRPRSSSSWPPLAYIVDDNLRSLRIRWEEYWKRQLWSNLRCYIAIDQEKLRKAMSYFAVICLRAEIRNRNFLITKEECCSLAAGSSFAAEDFGRDPFQSYAFRATGRSLSAARGGEDQAICWHPTVGG